MDPWHDHPFPHDINRCPDLNQQNHTMSAKISNYINSCNHVLVSCDKKYPVSECFKHYRNVAYKPTTVVEYIMNKQLEHIVYVGFHHGRCILNRPTGAKSSYFSNYEKWVVRDLVGVLCFDDPCKMDSKTQQYATLVSTR